MFECAICGKPLDNLKDVYTFYFNELIYCKYCYENTRDHASEKMFCKEQDVPKGTKENNDDQATSL